MPSARHADADLETVEIGKHDVQNDQVRASQRIAQNSERFPTR